MPDPHEPGSGHFTFAHGLTVVAGIIGVTNTAHGAVPATLGMLGTVAVWLWSMAFVLSGVLGLYARFSHLHKAETYAADMTSGATVLWAGMILYFSWLGGAGLQVGVWMIANASALHGWALYRRHRLTRFETMRDETRLYLEGE